MVFYHLPRSKNKVSMQILDYKLIYYIRTYRINSTGEAPIYLKIQIQERKMELSTKQFIKPTDWDPINELVKEGTSSVTKNQVLGKLKVDLRQVITNLYMSGQEITIENIKEVLGGGQTKKDYGLIEVVEEHNGQFEKQVGVLYSYGSYKNYKTSLSFLKEFIRSEYKTADLPLKKVNHKFCERFFIWLTTVKTCNQNGAGKHIQRLKKITNYAFMMSYVEDNPIRSYKLSFRTPMREALTWEEIGVLHKLKLVNPTLVHIRNLVLFQIYTGLAYADIKALSTEHLYKGVNGGLWLKMERTKTHNTFTLPILKPAQLILDQYITKPDVINAPIFKVMSNQKMNNNLKLIQQMAGISKRFHTHLFRHTFASTVTLQSGIPLETVSKMLGHSKITMTQIYARVGEMKIATDMKQLTKKLN